MTGTDLVQLLFVGALATVGMLLARRGLAKWEYQWAIGSLLVHAVATALQVWLVLEVYGIGDMLMYNTYGQGVSGLLQRSLLPSLPGLLAVLFHGDNTVGVFIPAAGTETGSMVVLTGLLLFLLGDSFYAVNAAFSVASFFGKMALYRGLKLGLPDAPLKPLFVSALWLPSCIFWSSGIIKEAVSMTGLGLLVYGVARRMRGGGSGSLSLLTGAILVGLIKPYILVAFALAASAWFYWQRASVRGGVKIRPLRLLLAAGIGVLALYVLGEMFPRYALGSFAEQAADMQFAGTRYRGGSTYSLGDPLQRSLLGQLTFVPVAVFTALYRPVIFEASNPQMLVNALETTLLLVVSVLVLVRHRPKGVWDIVKQRPMLIFCLVFVAVMSVAVGLTSSNLGTLSRYRMPMYPFFAVLLSVLLWAPRSVGYRPSRPE